MKRGAQTGYILAETLLGLLLLSMIFIQSAAIIYPLTAGVQGAHLAAEAGYDGVSVLEYVRLHPGFAYGVQEVSGLLPWEHDYQITLQREVFGELPEMDQYTVTVRQGAKTLVTLTTLAAQ
jgi:hypothetical protein